MNTRSVSGTEISLESGDYSARIVTVGAGLARLTRRGKDLIIPHSAHELPPAYLGKTLMPWPNRLAQGTYTWRGTTYRVPVNEPETGNALHGFMCWVDWNVIHADKDSTTLGAFIAPRPGYPWPLEAWVTYALSERRGLTVTLTAKNIGDSPAPYGVSSHPYLSLDGQPADSYELALPARTVLVTDEHMIPQSRCEAATLGLDFHKPRLIEDTTIDHAFTDLSDDTWSVVLNTADGSMRVALSCDAPWVQVYTADNEDLRRRGVAVEPMTCPPNAFNTGEDLSVLQPDESHTMSFTIDASFNE